MQRNFGLDLMRTAAILMVAAVHAPIVVLPLGLLRDVLFSLSVDLFFAISGFLIAQMIAERFDGIPSPTALGLFLVNRWLRIWPLYFLILGLFVAVFGLRHRLLQYPSPTSGFPWLPPIAQFSLFLQDMTRSGFFNTNDDAPFMAVSWSLCIEEWFYLLCPVVCLAAGGLRRSPIFWLAIGGALILAALAGRLAVYLSSDPTMGFDNGFRRVTMLRPDVFVYGAAVYWLVRNGLSQRARVIMASAGAAILAATVGLFHVAPLGFFAKVPALSLLPFGCALLIPAAIDLHAGPLITRTVEFLSSRTYALYLIHFPLLTVFGRIWRENPSLAYFAAVAMSLLLANLAHIALERPIMNLRPRYACVTRHKPQLAE